MTLVLFSTYITSRKLIDFLQPPNVSSSNWCRGQFLCCPPLASFDACHHAFYLKALLRMASQIKVIILCFSHICIPLILTISPLVSNQLLFLLVWACCLCWFLLLPCPHLSQCELPLPWNVYISYAELFASTYNQVCAQNFSWRLTFDMLAASPPTIGDLAPAWEEWAAVFLRKLSSLYSFVKETWPLHPLPLLWLPISTPLSPYLLFCW